MNAPSSIDSSKAMSYGSSAKCPPSGQTRVVDVLGVLAIIVISGLAYVVGLAPQLARQKTAESQRMDLAALNQKSIDLAKDLTVAQIQLIRARSVLSASPLHLQPASHLNEKLARVTELAAQGGAGLDNVQPGKSADGTQYNSLPIHVSGTGSFSTFAAMLHRFRAEFPDTAVNQFEVWTASQGDGGVGTFNFDLVWFTQPTRQDRTEKVGGSSSTDDKGRATWH